MKRFIAALMCMVFFAAPALAENEASVTIGLQFGSQTYTDEIDVRWNGDAADDIPVFYGTLKEGDTGRRVRELQEMLKRVFLYDGEIDGVFGPETAAAVRAYQRKWQAHGLTENGITDAAFYSSLYYELSQGATQDVAEEDSFGMIACDRATLYDSYIEEKSLCDIGIRGDLFRIKGMAYYAGTYWYYVENLYDHDRAYIQADELQKITEEQFKTEFYRFNEDDSGDDYKAERKVVGTVKIKEGHRVSQYTTDAKEKAARIRVNYVKGPATIECVAFVYGRNGDYYRTKEGYYIYDSDLQPEEKIAKGFFVVRDDVESVEIHSGPGNYYPVVGYLEKGEARPYIDTDYSDGFWYLMRGGRWVNSGYISHLGGGNEWYEWENAFDDFNETLSFGATSIDVQFIKEWLVVLRYLDGKNIVDSIKYDEKTQEAMKKFQKDNGLPETGDCDVETKRKLLEAFRAFMAG